MRIDELKTEGGSPLEIGQRYAAERQTDARREKSTQRSAPSASSRTRLAATSATPRYSANNPHPAADNEKETDP